MFRRIPFIVVVFIISIIGIPVGIIWPSARQIRHTSQSIYHEYQYLEERYKRGQSIKEAKKEYEEIQKNLPPLRAFALEPNEELKFITAIETLADSYRVAETLSLNVEGRSAADPYYAIPIELNIRGSYQDITQYIASLRTLPMVISLTSLSMTSARTMDTFSAKNNPNIKVEARLSGKIYQHQTEMK